MYWQLIIFDLKKFKRISNCIIVNSYVKDLDDVNDKVYSRDLFRRD